MSQIAGRRLPQAGAANQNFNFVAVANIDGQNNAGLATIAYGPNNTSYIDDTDAAALKIWYYLDKAPDADPSKTVWRVCRATVVSPGVSKYEWAYIPANVYKGSYADAAAINTAYAVGTPGWNAYNEDTATYWVWDPFAGPAAWVDTSSAVKTADSLGLFGGYDHAAADIRITSYN